MLYSFARVNAVIAMRRQNYFRQESWGWLRLHEKGGGDTTSRRTIGPPRPCDAAGALLQIVLRNPIQGPLAIGYGSYFGLGLFVAASEDGVQRG